MSDPPAGISFAGKHWDNDKGGKKQWIAWMQSVAVEALRVAKPGAHALVWALPRISNRTADAWEDAGWEIINIVHNLFGQGYPKGKNLKPAVEHWILLRKPLIGTIATNIMIYGTGRLNIDGCRVPFVGRDGAWGGLRTSNFGGGRNIAGHRSEKHDLGRWPANLVLSDQCIIDERNSARFFNQFHDDDALYVYARKANKMDRNGSKHPTIKGQDLMRWLVRLITPKGGTVLDPFAGSGSTGLAACSQGFSCILIEMELEYIEDCRKRLGRWL